MFGYIKAHRPELKVKENEYYRALYCGLCREMGRCTGQCSRLTLSYDLTFLSLVRMALSGTDPEIAKKSCIAHPLRKRAFIKSNPDLEMVACISSILTYYKVKDDLSDERGFSRLRARLVLPFAAVARRRAARRYPEIDRIVSSHIAHLSLLERSGCESADEAASVFGEMMGEMAAHGYDGAKRKIAYSIGKHVGKWTYFTDAIDDLARDAKSGSFNPILKVYKSADLSTEQKDELYRALTLELADAEAAFDLIENTCADGEAREVSEAIIKNVIYIGMPRVQRSVIYKDGAGASSERQKNE